ncbi:Pyocin activator protein PrtN [Rhizobium lusitanum]|uniref:Pyocin activator protein PrtN n=1 Tax=Rhizobium lusitanum TaxID=293958 RepID=A0A6L9U6Z5_9HYPH|nr:pyocin activator PrtN family protein [Rhizobium lusitanum]NEI71074.1 Pyocin activator protein PrtN [Rhizobium lusitanum]
MSTPTTLSTQFLLFAQYGGQAVIPVEDVCRDYFSHLTPDKFVRKASAGEIEIPVIRVESSQKSHKGVYLHDLAEYIDRRREAALKEFRQLHR